MSQAFRDCIQKIRNNEVEELKFPINVIKGSKEVSILSQALKINTSLQSLTLNFNQFGPQNTKKFCRFLHTNTTLKFLNMGFCSVGDIGAKAIGRALTFNTTLFELQLNNNAIGDIGIRYLARALLSNTTLKRLLIHNNPMTPQGIEILSECLSQNKSLRRLRLGSNNLGDDGVASLAKALVINNNLKDLNLESNKIGDKGVESLVIALPVCGINILNLDYNPITDTGAQMIAKAILHAKMRKLLLFETEIGEVGIKAIIDSLNFNHRLVDLVINYKDGRIPPKYKGMIDTILEKNRAGKPVSQDDDESSMYSGSLAKSMTTMELLDQLSLFNYKRVFAQFKVLTLESILRLTTEDWDKLGVFSLHRAKILNHALQELGKTPN